MIERLFNITYPDLYEWVEYHYLDVILDWQMRANTVNKLTGTGLSLELYLANNEPHILRGYEIVVRNVVKDFFRDLLNQEKE